MLLLLFLSLAFWLALCVRAYVCICVLYCFPSYIKFQMLSFVVSVVGIFCRKTHRPCLETHSSIMHKMHVWFNGFAVVDYICSNRWKEWDTEYTHLPYESGPRSSNHISKWKRSIKNWEYHKPHTHGIISCRQDKYKRLTMVVHLQFSIERWFTVALNACIRTHKFYTRRRRQIEASQRKRLEFLVGWKFP